ncbi:hypothetical protein [Nocardia sp. Marseille-Q1738]
MPRTPEQVKADDALTEAIEVVHRAYNDDVEGVLTTYVVLAQRTWWDEEGRRFAASYCTPKDCNVTLSEQLGMVEYASTVYRSEIIDSFGDGQ